MMMLIGNNDINGRVFIELNCIRARATQGRICDNAYIIILYLLYYIRCHHVQWSVPYYTVPTYLIFYSRALLLLLLYYIYVRRNVPGDYISYIYIYTSRCVVRMRRRWSALQNHRRQRRVDTWNTYIYIYVYTCDNIYIISMCIRPGIYMASIVQRAFSERSGQCNLRVGINDRNNSKDASRR